MGLLDDAIREHLDLKRRRGADPTEIERAEREALGPVRRGPEVGADDAPVEGVEPRAGVPSVPEEQWLPGDEDAELHEASEFHEPLPAMEDHEYLPPYEPVERVEREPLAEPSPFDAEADAAPPPHPTDTVPPPEPEPNLAPHPADPPRSVPEDLEQETEEYELEPEEHKDEDVLESTPEFLQDAPDHDRLWFEQRPPRDFDFDG
jgi:hypothetical protein